MHNQIIPFIAIWNGVEWNKKNVCKHCLVFLFLDTLHLFYLGNYIYFIWEAIEIVKFIFFQIYNILNVSLFWPNLITIVIFLMSLRSHTNSCRKNVWSLVK